MKAWNSRTGIIVLVLIGLAGLSIVSAPLIRRATESVTALGEIARVGRQAAADRTAHRNRMPAVRPRRVHYLIDGRFRTADLYLGDDAPKASLVLVAGADVLGREHPQFRALASVLSQLGFAVLVPHMENLQRLRIRAGDVTQIADAARHLARFAPRDRGASVGVMAVSYGVGPAVLAALDPKAGAQIRFVLGIGGYYDLEAVLTFFTTGHFRRSEKSEWQTARPLAHGKWVFLASNAEFLENPQDQVTLRIIAKRKSANPNADVSDLTPILSAQGKKVLDLITNTDPARVPALIDALPAEALAHFRALDVSEADLSDLHAQLILIHGRDDRLIPFTESLALAQASKRATLEADLYLIDEMAHVELEPSNFADIWKLYRAVFQLLSQRDAAPAPSIPPALAAPVDMKGTSDEPERTPPGKGRKP